jgi:heme-degrading monooxygenase HmoA
MTYISINRAMINANAAAEFEEVAERWLRSERERLPRDELLARQLVRGDGGTMYVVISVWTSRAAHDRAEDGPAEREALRLIAGYLAGEPEPQFTGEVVSEVR